VQTKATAVRVEGLAPRFSDVAAVDSVTFDVRRGEPFGFLGPGASAGAYKSLSFGRIFSEKGAANEMV